MENHSAPSDVKNWNGDDIVLFQEDLFQEVKGKVSEKWFYTYFKNDAPKLPRIDMLNLLSSYIEFENWHGFKSVHISDTSTTLSTSTSTKPVLSEVERLSTSEKKKKKNPLLWLIIFLPIIIVIVATMNSKNEFRFCFNDDLNSTIVNQMDIKLLLDNQSPLYFKTDSLACFNYETTSDKITFVVSSPYYKTDTIVRSIDNNEYQSIKLKSDDYALVLKYYTSGNVKDWKKHRQKIEKLIADDAKIYRHYHNNMGTEIYSKDEFVRLLTIPTSSLNRIRILNKDFDYNIDKIINLEFIID